MNEKLYDKRSAFQVLGCLTKHPEYIEEYGVTENDFEPDVFNRIVFSAIYNLYVQGAEVINSFAVDSMISQYENQYKIFLANNGDEFIRNIHDMSEESNFEFYVKKLKKFSLLRYLESQGYDVTRIFDYTITEPSAQEEEIRSFDELDIEHLLDTLEGVLITESKVRFCIGNTNQGQLMGKGLKELINSLQEAPEFGLPLQSPILTTASRGMRLRKIYIRSSSSGGGKSRLALADMCNISIPYYYDLKQKKWIFTGFSEPVLFISTELEFDEVQTIVIAYVSGVNEEHILSGHYIGDEKQRVEQAITYIESAPMYVEFMPNFDINSIETIIKKYHHTNGVNYVCFDYMHMSAKLIAELTKETKGMKGLREDQILFLFVDKLKNMCNILGIFLLTMTQLNGTYKDSIIKDESLLRGSKAIADRIDLGEISLPPSSADLKAIKSILAKQINKPVPNMVRHIYKLRRGKLSKIRIWQYVDLGTCRSEDLFVTNFNNELIPVDVTKIEEFEEVIKKESVDSSEELSIESEEKDEVVETKKGLAFDW